MWIAIGVGPDEVHVIPVQDLIEHTETEDCICGPTTTFLESGKLVTHASLDGRELNEPDWKG